MKIGIFGGTFNPVHNGHLTIAEKAQTQFGLGRVLFVPTATPPHKSEPDLADAAHRVEMLRLAVAGKSGWDCDEREVRRGGVSYTIDTLKQFRREQPKEDLFLILGSDNLLSFAQWRQPEAIAYIVKALVYPRPGAPLPANPKDFRDSTGIHLDYRVIEGVELRIAASEIRALLHDKKDASRLVPPKVLAYIQSHGLYS
jgi:nicotinate-nucleotide adenylyltransferase